MGDCGHTGANKFLITINRKKNCYAAFHMTTKYTTCTFIQHSLDVLSSSVSALFYITDCLVKTLAIT